MSIFNHKTHTLGADLSDFMNSLSRFGIIARRVFDYAILDIHDIQKTIGILQNRGERFTSLYAQITARKTYIFDGKEKEAMTAAAIVYDFVDGFVVSDISANVEKLVDPLLNLRLINDEYREIYLEVPEYYGSQEIDTLLEYVHYSNVDGLLLNEKQFDYVCGVGKGNLQLFVNNVTDYRKYDELIHKGAKAVFIKAKAGLTSCYFLDGFKFRVKSEL